LLLLLHLVLVLHWGLWPKSLYIRSSHHQMRCLWRWISSTATLPNFPILVTKVLDICLNLSKSNQCD
jgi:hypothetical protein